MSDDRFAAMRRAMVSNQLRTVAVDDPHVLAALGQVPREAFVPNERRDVAYADLVVPLGSGRELNTPMATARLINAAEISPSDVVMIVGAATGYATALVVLLGRSVVGVESDAELAATARANVPGATIVIAPLTAGDAAHGPYNVIVIDGAVEQLPQALIEQLAPGGRLAAGMVEAGVTRLAVGRAGGTGFALTAFADADIIVLPGFARPRKFVFQS